MTTIRQGGSEQKLPPGFFVVHDSDVPKKQLGLVTLAVRASSIDGMHPRKNYTTLDLGGHWIHVVEKIGELTKLIGEAEAELKYG